MTEKPTVGIRGMQNVEVAPFKWSSGWRDDARGRACTFGVVVIDVVTTSDSTPNQRSSRESLPEHDGERVRNNQRLVPFFDT